GDRPAHRGRTLRARRESGPLVAGRPIAFGAALLAGLTLAAAAHAGNPQIAGLQVALRAYGLYHGPVDAIAGPKTVLATKAFQRRAGLPVDGRAGPATRRALGPLGTPLLGPRKTRRRLLGRAARHAGLRPADAPARALRLGRLGAAVHARAARAAGARLRLLRPRHRAGAAALPAREAAGGGRDRRARHALGARPRNPGRAAGPPRARPVAERAHDADQLGDRVPARPGARSGARVDGVRLPARARFFSRRAWRAAGAAEHARLRREAADRPEGAALALRQHPHRRRLPSPAAARVPLQPDARARRLVPGAVLGTKARAARGDAPVRPERPSAADSPHLAAASTAGPAASRRPTTPAPGRTPRRPRS